MSYREGLEKLAPCECGRPAKIQGTRIVDGKATRWYARCELATCWFGPERDSIERASKSWNRRVLLAAGTEGLREAINKRANEFYGSGASAFSIDSRELAAKQCIADILEIANGDAALRGESPEPPRGEAADPDPNADGPAERAHRQDEARRMK